MFCRNCATQLDDRAIACPKCGVNPWTATSFCSNCGKPTAPNVIMCPSCGFSLNFKQRADKKIAAGICGIVVGAFGVHKFVLGYQTAGLIMLLVTVLTCGMGAAVMGIIGLVEGIIYLTKSDEDFVRTYVDGKKEWF